MDLKLTRVYVDELEAIRQAKVCIQLVEVNFFEEYLGNTLSSLNKPIVTIHLYSGDAICVLMKFEQFATIMEKFRKEQEASGLKFTSN